VLVRMRSGTPLREADVARRYQPNKRIAAGDPNARPLATPLFRTTRINSPSLDTKWIAVTTTPDHHSLVDLYNRWKHNAPRYNGLLCDEKINHSHTLRVRSRCAHHQDPRPASSEITST